ncbi:MinD/ParA family protein [Planococcus sp. A6]|uniref:MinD/ParA family protein n=1 Tax=Planococcus sp. A6 TaxID=2992760 RepID=UPI00237B5B92|nr:MinD/ParA family protein [Planococcus sp. A6]MDE0584553.1 MinD/ParA family protein [Planococcus sp. A6]
MRDQAVQLREKMSRKNTKPSIRNTRVLAVTSGKGGVGKSNFTLNFALALIEQGKSVLIIDVDLGFANIDILFGHAPRETIAGMLDKQLAIEDVIERGPLGLQLIAGGQGFSGLFELDADKMKRFMEQLGSLQGKVDFVLLDTGAGLSENNMRFLLAADEVLLVTTPEPTSVTDAYSVVKMMHAKDSDLAIRLVVNQCTDGKEGRQTAENFAEVAQRFLDKDIRTLGILPSDLHVPQAVKKQEPFLLAHPGSSVSKAMRTLAAQYLELPSPFKIGLRGFVMKLFFK